MASATKLVSMRPRATKDSPLTPELRDFIDRAIVPILVKEYLAAMEIEKELAVKPRRAAHSQRNTAATLRGRP